MAAAEADTVDEPLGEKELKSWYAFDWANSVYSSVAIGAYLPLLLQSCALENAGFPDNCPNYFANSTTDSMAAFNESDVTDFFIDNAQIGATRLLAPVHPSTRAPVHSFRATVHA